jgi:hypothetical protein
MTHSFLKENPMERNNRLNTVVFVNVLVYLSVFSVFGQDTIPRTGLKLWITADSVQMTGTEVAKIYDLSGNNNSPIHFTDVPNITTVPSVVKTASRYNGHAVLHFPGSYTGFSFSQITGIRSVFAVLFKDSTSCNPNATPGSCCVTSPKFWLGQMNATTNFHADHGCCIFRNDFNEASPCVARDGFVSIDGGPKIAKPTLTFMPFHLGLLTILASCGVQASTIGRDRTMTDRSYQGDIAEILIYTTVLDTPTVRKIQNILMAKYNIGGHTPVVKPNGFSDQREVAPMVSIIGTTRQSMKLALTGAGVYSLSISNMQGRTVFHKNGVAPDAIILKETNLTNGFYYVTGKIKNSLVRQNLALVW